MGGAEDAWAAMQASESKYTSRNRHRLQQPRSLASLNQRSTTHPAANKQPQPLAFQMPAKPCMTAPLYQAVVQNMTADMCDKAILEPSTVAALPTRSFADAEPDMKAEGGEMTPQGFAEQLEQALTATARDLNILTAPEKMRRQEALRSIEAKLLSPPLHPTVIALALPHVCKPLLKRFEDPVESVRDLAVNLLRRLLQHSADIEQVVQYTLPVTLERLRPAAEAEAKPGLSSDNPSLAPKLPPELRGTRDLEESEEVRCALLRMLRLCLVPRLNSVTSMQYLADLCGCIIRNCRHKAPNVAIEAAGVCVELATVLWSPQYKCSILRPYCERLCLGLMYALYAKSSKVRAVAVVALRKVILCGETKLIQDMAAWTPPNHLDLTQYYHPRAKRNTLAHLAEDNAPAVRANFYEMCEAICKEPYYAAEEDGRLIPYLLSGTYDPLPELARKAFDIIEGLGKHYEELNEKDFIDLYDYDGDAPYPGVVWRPPVPERPGMGARLLVRSRVNKVLKPLCRELLDPNNQDGNRLKCAKLLQSHVLYSERNLAGDAPSLLKITLGAGGLKLLHQQIQPTLDTLGRYIEPELYLPLCLPHLRKPDVGHAELGRLLASIATLLSGSAATQAAAEASRDTRYAGMKKVSLLVLREFVAEITQQQYCVSTNAATRRGICEVMRYVAHCPVALQCEGLCFALVQARETAPDATSVEAADAGLRSLARQNATSIREAEDTDALCRVQWAGLEAEAVSRGVRTRLQSQQQAGEWLATLRRRLGMPEPPPLPVPSEPLVAAAGGEEGGGGGGLAMNIEDEEESESDESDLEPEPEQPRKGLAWADEGGDEGAQVGLEEVQTFDTRDLPRTVKQGGPFKGMKAYDESKSKSKSSSVDSRSHKARYGDEPLRTNYAANLFAREQEGALGTKKAAAKKASKQRKKAAKAERLKAQREARAKETAAAAAEESSFVIDDEGEEIDPDDIAPPTSALAQAARANLRKQESLNALADFIPSSGWVGVYDGYYFGCGERGVGYYLDGDGGEFSRALQQAGQAIVSEVGAAATTTAQPAGLTRVMIAEDSDDESSSSNDGDGDGDSGGGIVIGAAAAQQWDESDLDQELLADLDSRSAEDNHTAEGLAGWFDEQCSTFRYNAQFKAKMLRKYGSRGAFEVAARAITNRRALRLANVTGETPPASLTSDRYNPQGSVEYKKAVAGLNDEESGPTTVQPGKLAAKIRGEPTMESSDRAYTDYPNSALIHGHKQPQPAPTPPPLSAEAQAALEAEQGAALAQAEVLKQAGNGAVKAAKHQLAVAKYSEALSLVGKVPPARREALKLALHNNRAMAFLQCENAHAAVADASVVLHLSHTNPKALFRRGQCYAKLGQWANAVVDLQTLCELQPSNAAARHELELAQAAARKEAAARFSPTAVETGGEGGQQQQGASKKIQIIEDSDDDSDDEDEQTAVAAQGRAASAAAPGAVKIQIVEDSDDDSDDETLD